MSDIKLVEFKVNELELRPGDIVTFDTVPFDTRSWWQQHAPIWLGGILEPPHRFVVTRSTCTTRGGAGGGSFTTKVK